MTAQMPVSPILRRDLSPIGLDSAAEEGLKSPSPKPKFAPRASSPALPAAAVHPGGPLRTCSILKKPLETPGGGYNWFGGAGEGEGHAGQAVRPLSPPLASHAGPGLGLGEPVHASSPESALSPPQSASLHSSGSPLPGAWSTSHAIASAAVSDSGQSTPAGSAQGSRASSPHCHFAPLPKVDGDRPGTRRNSFAQGVRSKILALSGGAELSDEPATLDSEDPLSHEFSKLSTGPPPPPTERGGDRYPRTRRSSSGRSTSPSPSRRPTSALSGTTSASSSSAPTSRSHSPAMSRHASGDALHLHFIQAAPQKAQRSVSQTRDGGSAGEALPVLELAHRGKQERRDSSSAVGSPLPLSPGRSAVASPTLGQQQLGVQHEVVPLHSAATAVAPLPATRKTSFVEPSVHELQRDRSPSIVNRCKPSNQDIVALDPLAGAETPDDELEEVEEEDEEEDDEDDDRTEGEDDERDRDESEEDDDEDDDEDEDEEDSEAEKMRKTAISGGVEVVHWRKEDPEEE